MSDAEANFDLGDISQNFFIDWTNAETGVDESSVVHNHQHPPRDNHRQRSRHPTAQRGNANVDLDLLSPEEFLRINQNGNTKKNEEVAMTAYTRVMNNLSEKSGEVFPPLQETPVDQLPYLLLRFLQSMKKANGEVYASASLNTLFNGLCNILAKRPVDPVNVKPDPRFKKVLEMLKVKTSLSASEGRGAGCDAKRPVTSEHLRMAIEAETIGRNSPKALVTATYLAAVLGWGCRAGAECHMIENGDLIFGPLSKKTGVPEWIELSERITKT